MARILVIDDQPEIRRLIRQLLESAGHTVVEASNGAEGLRLQQAGPAEVIITDLFMPEMDGIEVLTALRRLNIRVPVIAISGGGQFGQLDLLRTARRLGAFRSLTKPFALRDLLDASREALAAGAAPPDAPEPDNP